MMQITRVVTVFALLTMSGCFSYGVRSRTPTDGVLHRVRGPVFAWGLAGKDHLAPECANGVARVKSSMPGWGGLVGLVTLGIVVPWRVEYVCAAAEGTEVVGAQQGGTAATEGTRTAEMPADGPM